MKNKADGFFKKNIQDIFHQKKLSVYQRGAIQSAITNAVCQPWKFSTKPNRQSSSRQRNA